MIRTTEHFVDKVQMLERLVVVLVIFFSQLHTVNIRLNFYCIIITKKQNLQITTVSFEFVL